MEMSAEHVLQANSLLGYQSIDPQINHYRKRIYRTPIPIYMDAGTYTKRSRQYRPSTTYPPCIEWVYK